MNRLGIILVCFVLLATGSLSGQQQTEEQRSERSRNPTIEELYLSRDVELQIIRSQALSSDRATKMLALQSLRSMAEDERLTSDDSGMFTLLESLAMEGTAREVRSDGAVINNFPEIRRQAVNLIGEVGGDRAKRTLINVLEVENEPMVQAEAVYALGKIEDSPESITLDYIARVLSEETAQTTPDNNLAFASLLAIEKIARRTGGVHNPEVIDALLGVASGAYVREVRLKAINVIYNLRG